MTMILVRAAKRHERISCHRLFSRRTVNTERQRFRVQINPQPNSSVPFHSFSWLHLSFIPPVMPQCVASSLHVFPNNVHNGTGTTNSYFPRECYYLLTILRRVPAEASVSVKTRLRRKIRRGLFLSFSCLATVCRTL